ncbi:MAG: hypothetical protein GXP14_07370 [Gammaproteobacteria bacterium]|nr:hypothetical protein [Gammaproteobacteria bacterium]
MFYIATDNDIEYYKSCGLKLLEKPDVYDGPKHWHRFEIEGEEKGFNAAKESTAWAIAAISFGVSNEI